jgi:hypothetical protein
MTDPAQLDLPQILSFAIALARDVRHLLWTLFPACVELELTCTLLPTLQAGKLIKEGSASLSTAVDPAAVDEKKNSADVRPLPHVSSAVPIPLS